MFSVNMRAMRRVFFVLAVLVIPLWAGAAAHARGVYQTPQAFIAQTFNQKPPTPKFLWLDAAMQAEAQKILGHPFGAMRVRYWADAVRTVWILDEIGKEEPITTGIVVRQGKIDVVKVLEFRESRGDEVRHPFFTDQFRSAGTNSKGELDKSIDGISGATLSVTALKKLARLALYFDRHAKRP